MAIKENRKNKKRKQVLFAFLSNKKALFGLFLLCIFLCMAILGPHVYDYRHDEYFLGERFQQPDTIYLLGLDELGRDVFGMIIYGAKASIVIGLSVAVLTSFFGTIVGLISGYYGGKIDLILMRFTEGFMLIPSLPLILCLAAIIGQKMSYIIWILSLTAWTGTARLVRAQTMSLKERNYIERAKSLGGSGAYIMVRHLLPNVFPIIFSQMILLIQNAIIQESTLAFIGIGDPTVPTWGQLLRSARIHASISMGAWWMYVPAGLCIVLLASSFVFIGYGIDEIIHPRVQKGYRHVEN